LNYQTGKIFSWCSSFKYKTKYWIWWLLLASRRRKRQEKRWRSKTSRLEDLKIQRLSSN
jgi:hypothetical protein